jgi:cardiolipin synthase
LVIWDPQVADPQMIRLLSQRQKAGLDIRILGKVARRSGGLRVQKMPGARLHVRAMVRDGDSGFVGSQSLRALELDGRREVGVIFKDPKVARAMLEVFERDWARTELGKKELEAHEKELALAEAG